MGLGPAGELRYPSYPEGDGRWRFPGVGEFQCFDAYMLASLKSAAEAAGHPEWWAPVHSCPAASCARGMGCRWLACLSGSAICQSPLGSLACGEPQASVCDAPSSKGNDIVQLSHSLAPCWLCRGYNSAAWETGFFVSDGGSWNSDYGHFFLSWYSRQLMQHADRVLGAAAAALNRRGRPRKAMAVKEVRFATLLPGCCLSYEQTMLTNWRGSRGWAGLLCFGMPAKGIQIRVLRHPSADLQHADGHVVYEFEPACHLGAKLAGVHWWFKSRVHAAELTAGYYNTRERDGYADLMAVLRKHSARLSFTCVEMRDCEHPPEGRCSPEGKRPLSMRWVCHWVHRAMHRGAACWRSVHLCLDTISGI